MHLVTLLFRAATTVNFVINILLSVRLSEHMCECDMRILLGLDAYFHPSQREYSCAINVLLMMVCASVLFCVSLKYQLYILFSTFKEAQAFINNKSSKAPFAKPN